MNNRKTDLVCYETLDHWKTLRAPVRPSQHMQTIYEDYMKRYLSEPSDWGLLGCTPELRSLASDYASSLICLDRDEIRYHSFALMCDPHPQESFHQCDWLHAEMPESFNMVMGDGSTSMLPLQQYPHFLKTLHSMLRPGGHAFLRIQVSNTNPFVGPIEVIEWHRENHRDQPIYRTTSSYFQLFWQDPDLGVVNTEIFSNQLDKLYDNGDLVQEEYQEYQSHIPPYPISFVEQDDFEAMCNPYFQILEVTFPEDFINSELFPVYALKKK